MTSVYLIVGGVFCTLCSVLFFLLGKKTTVQPVLVTDDPKAEEERKKVEADRQLELERLEKEEQAMQQAYVTELREETEQVRKDDVTPVQGEDAVTAYLKETGEQVRGQK